MTVAGVGQAPWSRAGKGTRLFAAEAGILLTSGFLCQKTKTGKVEHPLGILEQSGGNVVRKLAAQRL